MTFSEKTRITREDWEQHDCHYSAEDGCLACEAWFAQEEAETCPEGACDGSGRVLKLLWDADSKAYYPDGEEDCVCQLKEDDQYDPDNR